MTALLELPTTDDLTAMSPAQFVELIREQLRQPGGGMHNHPIIEAMEAGTATKEQLTHFGAQFYLHISKMLPWIGLMYVNCPFPEVRSSLVKNLAEEELGIVTNTAAHPALLLKWLNKLGASDASIVNQEQLPEGRRLTEYFEFMGRCRPWFVPLAAIGIGLESFVPDTFRRIVAAQKKHYGMTDDDLIFWTMHILADAEHGDEGIEIVSEYATDAAGRKQVFDCTVETGKMFFDLWNVYKLA